MFARMQESVARIQYLEGIVKENPVALLPRLALAEAFSDTAPAKAVPLYETLLSEELGPHRPRAIRDYLACLVATGQIHLAWDFLSRHPFPATATAEEIAIQGRISSLTGSPELGRTAFNPRERARADVIQGLQPAALDNPPEDKPQLGVIAMARRKLPQSMLNALQAPSQTLAIPSAWLWPMLCELDRVQPDWVAKLEPALGANRGLVPRVLRFVETGEPFPNMDQLLTTLERSGVWLARARWLEANADPKESRKAFEAANAEVSRLDVFKLGGAALRETWEPAQPATRTASQWSVIDSGD